MWHWWVCILSTRDFGLKSNLGILITSCGIRHDIYRDSEWIVCFTVLPKITQNTSDRNEQYLIHEFLINTVCIMFDVLSILMDFSSPEYEVLSELLWFFNVRRPSSVRPCVRPSTISLNKISSETAYWTLTKLHRNDPWVVPYQSCSNRSSWLHKHCQNWPRPGGHNFTLNYIRKTSNNFLSWTANGNLAKLNRNGPWVIPYKICSTSSDWLHK